MNGTAAGPAEFADRVTARVGEMLRAHWLRRPPLTEMVADFPHERDGRRLSIKASSSTSHPFGNGWT
jgi:hypothetical protein